jgi:hypothetical protein
VSTVEVSAAPPRRHLIRQLWFQVLAATAVGILLGHYYSDVAEKTKPLGDLFINLWRELHSSCWPRLWGRWGPCR